MWDKVGLLVFSVTLIYSMAFYMPEFASPHYALGQTAPAEVALPVLCTIQGLSLKTTTLSEYDAKVWARAKWGDAAIVQTRWEGYQRYSIREMGFVTPFGTTQLWKNEVGSFRKLVNSILIEECERQQH